MKSLHGKRDAGQTVWEETGLSRGKASTCLHSDVACGVCAAVQGDDVTIKAPRSAATRLKRKFEERYEIKAGHWKAADMGQCNRANLAMELTWTGLKQIDVSTLKL